MYLIFLLSLGVLAGIIFFSVIAYKFTTFFSSNLSNDVEEVEDLMHDEVIPLAYRINSAIFETERSLIECDEKIEELVKDIDDLLSGVGERSYIYIPDKPLFIQFTHPLTGDSFYLYEKDLLRERSAYDKEKSLCGSIQKQIDLIVSQRAFFKKLLRSHIENLQRVEGGVRQSEHLELIKTLEEKIERESQDQTNDEKIVYNDLIIDEIKEELDHQDECLRQYKILMDDIIQPQNEDQPVLEKLKELTEQLPDTNDPDH